MKAKFSTVNTDNIEMEMKITMSLMEWKRLKDSLQNVSRSDDFHYEICRLIGFAEQHFYPKDESI